MISLVETLNFRCLRYIKQPLGSFHVLIGPNASGKTTFLDVISFAGQLITEGTDAAVEARTGDFRDLIWNHGTGKKKSLTVVGSMDSRCGKKKLAAREHKEYYCKSGRNQPEKKMHATGVIRGKRIELEQEIGLPDGAPVELEILPRKLSLEEKLKLVDSLCGAWEDDESLKTIFVRLEKEREGSASRYVEF